MTTDIALPWPLVGFRPGRGPTTHRPAQTLPAVDPAADRRFRELLCEAGLEPDGVFTDGYVEWEWAHSRHLFEELPVRIAGAQVLELGCHIGATAIVLALMGADVTAIDVNPRFLSLARANAERYGVVDRIRFLLVPEPTMLPFALRTFDIVTCNSVLEYVAPATLPELQREMVRVLRPDGLAVILGTSNRIWPRELHSRQWTNYLPRFVDRWLARQRLRRGVTPWRVRGGFPGFSDVLAESPTRFLRAKARMGLAGVKLRALAFASRLLGALRISAGSLLPTITMVLRKP
jgi:SAM-dependent methyltransferase